MMTELPVTPLTKNDFAQNVFGRRSIRKFDSDFKITRAEMQEILTQAGRAPSSMNLQPWRFVVVDSTAGKTKLHDLVMTNTPQNDTASAMIIVFGVDHPERDDAKIYDAAVAAGTMTPPPGMKKWPKLTRTTTPWAIWPGRKPSVWMLGW